MIIRPVHGIPKSLSRTGGRRAQKESGDEQKQNRIIRRTDKTVLHTLEENLPSNGPILGNTAFRGIKTWRNLFIWCWTSCTKRSARFARLPQEENSLATGQAPLCQGQESLRRGKVEVRLICRRIFPQMTSVKTSKSCWSTSKLTPKK